MKSSQTSLADLLQQLRQAGAALPAEMRPLVDRLYAVVGKLPAGTSLDALKKPGAWFDVPLPPTTASTPYYVKTPIEIDVVNVSSPELRADLFKNPAEAVSGGSLVTISPSPVSLPTT